jgi:hypothetical protein
MHSLTAFKPEPIESPVHLAGKPGSMLSISIFSLGFQLDRHRTPPQPPETTVQ